MIIIPSAYSFQMNQRFPATDHNSTGITESQNRQQDSVTLSGQGKKLSALDSGPFKKTQNESMAGSQKTEEQKDQSQNAQDLEILQQLKKRDAEVRAHEQAHLAVAGRYAAGSISYSYQTGPDGVKYAIGGEVPIDISAEGTPEATIQKMETVRRAALAPADPSPADLQIAAAASAKEIQAMQESQAIQREKANPNNASDGSGAPSSQNNSDTLHTPHTSWSPPSSPSASSPISPGHNRQMMIQTYQAMASVA